MELSFDKKADIFLSIGNIQKAISHYLLFLKEMKDGNDFKNFAKGYAKFLKIATKTEILFFQQEIIKIFEGKEQPLGIKKELEFFLKKEHLLVNEQKAYQDFLSQPFFMEVKKLSQNDKNFDGLTKLIIKETNTELILFALDFFVLDRKRNAKTIRIDEYVVSVYEKYQRFDNALKIALECLKVKINPLNVRTIFRICRKKDNYSEVDNLLKNSKYNSEILNSSFFDILYELVFYYDFYKNENKRDEILNKIEKQFADIKPIQRTLQNFYVKFGKIDTAIEKIENTINQRKNNNDKFSNTEDEIEYLEEIKYNLELAAVAELTNGISHEFGQPITNIRYTIQFYSRLFEKKLDIETLKKVFSSILEETERMGNLNKRLSPITSSKNMFTSYDLKTSIVKIISGAMGRLNEAAIQVQITENQSSILEGDESKFEQIISNLLFNSIDAILENPKSIQKTIKIELNKIDDKYAQVIFADTGVGIPKEMHRKIFKPFYTTKEPHKGQGLGLFIVNNLLEYIGGKIKIQTEYNKGASFELLIPLKSQELKLKNHELSNFVGRR